MALGFLVVIIVVIMAVIVAIMVVQRRRKKKDACSVQPSQGEGFTSAIHTGIYLFSDALSM